MPLRKGAPVTMPRKAGVKKIDFASAPRAVLAGKYVQAHIDKWNCYKKDMMIVGKEHFEQFVDCSRSTTQTCRAGPLDRPQ